MTYAKTYTMSARLRALDLLRTVCRLDQDGFAVYDPGWSDKRVAREVKAVSTPVVKGLRREYIGKARSHSDNYHAAKKASAAPAPAVVVAAEHPLDHMKRIERKLDIILQAWGLGEGDDAATLRHK